MKKVALVCLMLVVLTSAASADYVWNMLCTDSAGGSFGSQVRTGFKVSPGTTSGQSWPTSTLAYGAYVEYTGNLDATMVKSGLYKMNYDGPDDPKKFILAAWCGSDYAESTFKVKLWGSGTTTLPTGDWKLNKLYDPISNEWGKTELAANFVKVTAGTTTDPWVTVTLPVFKAADPMPYGKGYILELTNVPIPEPGSMVAMLSGLVGLVGFGIRRRK